MFDDITEDLCMLEALRTSMQELGFAPLLNDCPNCGAVLTSQNHCEYCGEKLDD